VRRANFQVVTSRTERACSVRSSAASSVRPRRAIRRKALPAWRARGCAPCYPNGGTETCLADSHAAAVKHNVITIEKTMGMASTPHVGSDWRKPIVCPAANSTRRTAATRYNVDAFILASFLGNGAGAVRATAAHEAYPTSAGGSCVALLNRGLTAVDDSRAGCANLASSRDAHVFGFSGSSFSASCTRVCML
jgi:hypothetical protein